MGIGKNKVCCWILAIECLFFELVLVVNPVDITKRQRIVLFACVLAHGAEKVKKVQERGEKGKKRRVCMSKWMEEREQKLSLNRGCPPMGYDLKG